MTVYADDRGLLLGDGLFETVLFKAGRPVLWDAHLERLRRGCAALGLPAPDPARLAEAAREAVEAQRLGAVRAAVRLTWTAGPGERGLARPLTPAPRLIVSAAANAAARTDAAVMTASVRRNAGSPASRLKSLSYLDNVLARREATAAGADEALMLNTDGLLACASAANLFWIAGDRLLTPALEVGVLDGIMRAAVIEAARRLGADVLEVHAGPDALQGVQAAALTSSLIGLRRVAFLDGRTIGGHRLLAALQDACGVFA